MPHYPKPRWRKDRNTWVVEVGKTLYTLGPDRDRALERYHQLMADPSVKRTSSPPIRGVSPTLQQAADQYLDHVQATCQASTYETARARLELACDAFGERRLDRIEPVEVERWLAGRGRSDSTRRAYLVAFRAAVKHARRRPTCYAGPDPTAEVPTPPATRRERVLEADELRAMLSAASSPFREFLEALAITGARPHILADLEVSGIRWASGEAVVRSKRRDYTLHLTPRLEAILRPLAAQHEAGLVFRTSRGGRWTRNAIRLRVSRLRESLGLDAGVVAYTFRHTFATDALARGESPAVVAEVMGHRDLTMLSRHYSHLARRRTSVRELAARAAESVPGGCDAGGEAPSPPRRGTRPGRARKSGQSRPARRGGEP